MRERESGSGKISQLGAVCTLYLEVQVALNDAESDSVLCGKVVHSIVKICQVRGQRSKVILLYSATVPQPH